MQAGLTKRVMSLEKIAMHSDVEALKKEGPYKRKAIRLFKHLRLRL